MGKASSRKRISHHDPASCRFEPAGPMNDLAIRNYAKTTLAALEHVMAVFQVVIDEGGFEEARRAAAVSFTLAVLADNIHGQLTLRPGSLADNRHAIAQLARRYPNILTVDGVEVSLLRGH